MRIPGVTGRFLVKMSCPPYLLPDAETEGTGFLFISDLNSTVFPTIVRHLFFLRTHLRNTY
jgi:hypothetical protein